MGVLSLFYSSAVKAATFGQVAPCFSTVPFLPEKLSLPSWPSKTVTEPGLFCRCMTSQKANTLRLGSKEDSFAKQPDVEMESKPQLHLHLYMALDTARSCFSIPLDHYSAPPQPGAETPLIVLPLPRVPTKLSALATPTCKPVPELISLKPVSIIA